VLDVCCKILQAGLHFGGPIVVVQHLDYEKEIGLRLCLALCKFLA